MKSAMAFTERFDRALDLAHQLHREQVRKGTQTPYIAHLLSVAALVAEHGGTEDQVIAALLHDAVEDQGGEPTAARIRQEFGAAVHDIVMGCTDSVSDDPRNKPPWEDRKRRYIEHIKTAPAEVWLVSAADKVHNARSIVGDLRRTGEAVWTLFKGGRKGTLWYYASLVSALRETKWDNPIVDELARVVAEMERLAGEEPPRPL
jgi:(p)ppGpp synthase/HD superfamily hydrolase